MAVGQNAGPRCNKATLFGALVALTCLLTTLVLSTHRLSAFGPFRNAQSAAAQDKSKLPYVSKRIAEFADDNLQLYMRLSYNHSWGEARSVMLQSQLFFWPHVRTHIVFDAEDISGPRGKEVLAEIEEGIEDFRPLRISHSFAKPYIGYNLEGAPGGPDCKCVWHGYQRGHLDMLFADRIVKSKYVGLTDTDAMFVTLVTPESIFSAGGRPRVFGVLGRANRGADVMWRNIAASTAYFLKKDYVVACMAYFPVIIATAHIKEMRSYVEKMHGQPFIKVYKEMFMKWGFYCHFSIMCNYVWHFHRNDYTWHYHNYQQNRPSWDTPIPGQIHKFNFLTLDNLKPRARVSTHASYTILGQHLYNAHKPELIAVPMTQGFCYALLAQAKTQRERESWSRACQIVRISSSSTYQVLLFRFESWLSWEWSPHTHEAQMVHYDTVKRAPYWAEYGKKILKQRQPIAWKNLTSFRRRDLHRPISS